MSFAGYPHAGGSKQCKSVGKLEWVYGFSLTSEVYGYIVHLKMARKKKVTNKVDRLPTVFFLQEQHRCLFLGHSNMGLKREETLLKAEIILVGGFNPL